MRIIAFGLVTGLTLATVASPLRAADGPATTPATLPATTQSADVWQQLTSPDFAEREAATNAIWAIGEAARDRLNAEVATGSVDKQERCRRILWLLDLGATPNLPAGVLNALTGYDYAAPVAERQQRIVAMRPLALAGSPLLLKLGLEETEPQIQQMIYGISAARAVPAYVESLLNADPPNLAAVEAFAKAYETASGRDPVPRSLRLCLLELSGQLNAEIDALQTKNLKQSMPDRRRLALLLCAAGRDAEAMNVAQTQPLDIRLLRPLLIRTADWKGLQRSYDESPIRDSTDSPAVAACQRLAGDAAGATERMQSWLVQQNVRMDGNRRSVAGRLLMSDMPEQGFPLWANTPDGTDVLRLAGRWKEALAVPKTGAITVSPRQWEADHNEMLAEIGEIPYSQVNQRETPEPWRADWQAAADAYRKNDFMTALQACDRVLTSAKTEAAAMRLKSICLGKLGQKEQAAAVHRLVELRCHGLYVAWLQMMDRLDSVGLTDLGDAEADRLLRAEPDWFGATLGVFQRNARQAAKRRDWPAAARAADQMLLATLANPINQLRASGYVMVPYESHLYHARAAWEANDFPAAVAHAKAANALLPIEGSIQMEFVPKLVAAGDTKTADELFDSAWQKMTKLAADYPKAAHLRNSAAWMALRCDRKLDDALKLAEQCVALRPAEASYLDTLAEAQFRNGKKDDAVATMQRAIKLMPDNAMLKDRLAAFQAGKLFVPAEE